MKNIKQVLIIAFTILSFVACKKDTPTENKPPIVNAGNDTTFQLSHAQGDTILLSGSATDADGQIAGYTWTQISGPNTAKIHYPGAASTNVSSVIAGKYVFQLMATDNKGATGVKTVTINITLPPVVTLNLQPSSNQTEVRIGIVGGQDISGQNFKNIAAVAWTVNGSIAYIRGLFKFDLSSIPATAKILTAKLSLYSDPAPTEGNLVDANYGNNNAMILQRAVTNWNVSTASWQSQPAGDPATQIAIPHTNQSTLDLIDLDVTAQVKSMQQYGNYGFLLKLQDENIYTSRIFCSSTANDASKHPKLVVQYSY
jgi:hypothetical protein